MREERTNLDDTLSYLLRKPHPEKRPTVVGVLRARFITGVLVALPLVVTIFFARFMFNLLDRWSYPLSKYLFGKPVYGVGAGLAIILIFMLGVLAHNVLGRRLLLLGDKLLGKVPVLRAVYTGTREVTRAFSGDRTKNFRRVVLVPFPVEGAYVIGFQTGEMEIETPEGRRKMVSVFFPTTPNPTTGFFIVYPAEKVIASSLAVEEAVRIVISAGLVPPDPLRLFNWAGTVAVSPRQAPPPAVEAGPGEGAAS
jgi:uncharacterized membrane protein